jgi:exosortase A
MVNIETNKPQWRHPGIAIVVLLLLTIVLYRQTIVYLTGLWNEISVGEYAHGYLVIAICLYLIISNRRSIFKVAPCPSYSVLPLVLLSSLTWLAAVLVDVEMLQSVGLLLIVFTLVWAVAGHQAMKLLAFPILFITFAIPVWFPLSPLLQDLTAEVVFWITRALEIPAFRQENLIVVPAGIFSIEEACSGLRYLLAALTLGALYAYMNYVTLPARVAVVLVTAAAAILANILRVFIVVYVGYKTEMQHPWVEDHLMLGWYLFGGLMAIMLFLDTRLYRQGSAADMAVIVAANDRCCNRGQRHYLAIALLGSLILLTGPAVIYLQNNQQPVPVTDILIALPDGADGWTGPMVSDNNWMPVYKGSIEQKMDYKKQTDTVTLYIAYYPRQKQGEEVINVINQITNNKKWRLKYAHARDRQLPGYSAKEQLIENAQSEQRLIWYWYNIGGEVTINKYQAKLLQLVSLVKRHPQSYVVAVSVDIKQDIEFARESLLDFTTVMEGQLANLQVAEVAR